MPANHSRSLPRTQAREAEKKLYQAIKVISKAAHDTGPIPDNFKGYKAPAGDFTDNLGRRWQYQITVVCAKSEFLDTNKVIPMFKGWTVIVRVKAFLKYLVDSVNK